jgi:hypothetical protein
MDLRPKKIVGECKDPLVDALSFQMSPDERRNRLDIRAVEILSLSLSDVFSISDSG